MSVLGYLFCMKFGFLVERACSKAYLRTKKFAFNDFHPKSLQIKRVAMELRLFSH